MVSRKVFDKLKELYGTTSSWTIWAEPVNGNWKTKDAVSDMTPFKEEDELIGSLNGDYIFVALNPAVHNLLHPQSVWENFHSNDSRRSQDYKLRYALYGTDYWGSFITDLYVDIHDTNSGSAMGMVTNARTRAAIDDLCYIRELLGGHATIIALGGKTYTVLKKNLPEGVLLKKIMHYSNYINPEKYRENVQNGLIGPF